MFFSPTAADEEGAAGRGQVEWEGRDGEGPTDVVIEFASSSIKWRKLLACGNELGAPHVHFSYVYRSVQYNLPLSLCPHTPPQSRASTTARCLALFARPEPLFLTVCETKVTWEGESRVWKTLVWVGNCSYRPIACHLPATCAVINEALNCFGILEFELLLQYSLSMGHDNPPQFSILNPQSSCECESEKQAKNHFHLPLSRAHQSIHSLPFITLGQGCRQLISYAGRLQNGPLHSQFMHCAAKKMQRKPYMAKNEAKKGERKKYEEQVASACCCREFATICYTVSLRFSTQDSGLGHGAQQWTVNTPPVRPAPALLELCRSWRCDCDVWHQILRLKTAAGVIAWFSHFPHFHLSFLCRSHTLTRS